MAVYNRGTLQPIRLFGESVVSWLCLPAATNTPGIHVRVCIVNGNGSVTITTESSTNTCATSSTLILPIPKRGHLVSWPRVIWVWPNQGYLVFTVFSCLGFLSSIELCIFLCHLVLFVSLLAKWLAGKTILSWYLLCQKVSLTKARLKRYLL